MTNPLTLDVVKDAVAGSAAAFRRVVELQPVGGPGAKVYPPTYEGGRYATEKRRINGETVDCVLLDSVQSQANRMEAALQEAWEQDRLKLPVITVDFTKTVAPWAGKITSLQAPHRIADAILRDSEWNGSDGKVVPFRKTSMGAALDTVSLHNATALFEYCPTALVFGMWDSTGARGGLGAKFARAVVSEIIGIGAVPGQRTSSRIDPLQIAVKAGPVYLTPDEKDWTLDPANAKKNERNASVMVGKKGRPSEINHGNVTPSLAVQRDRQRVIEDQDGNPIPIGGFTIDRAQQISIVSLPALRRLKFPLSGSSSDASDRAARTVLTALALCAVTLSGEQGYDLRSQCLLTPTSELQWELMGAPGQTSQAFGLNGVGAVIMLAEAVAAARTMGLPWNETEVKLTPRADLATLVQRSIAAGGASAEEEGE